MPRLGSALLPGLMGLGLANLVCASPQTTASPSTSSPNPTEARIDALAQGVVGKKTPGVAVVVQQGGRTLYRKAFGSADLAGKIPATTATPFKIASLSKAFTAAIVQKLAADGKLKLTDPVASFFPSAPEAWNKITVRHLLNQVSGLPEYTVGLALTIRSAKPGDPQQVLAWAIKKPLNFAPGTKFEYSNTNYVLLGLIAEKASGAPLETQLQSRIFDPLGMKSAKLPRKETSTPGAASGAVVKAGKLVASGAIDAGWPYAAGSVVASADDLALWLGGLVDAKVLTEAQRTEAFTPATLPDGEFSFYGYGWVLGTRGAAPMISHGGTIEGFSSYVAYLPASDVRLVILMNAEGSDPWTLAGPILDAVEGKEVLPSIKDQDPKLTARLRTVIDKMLKGERDPMEFDAGFLKAVPDDVYAKTGRGLGEIGTVEEFSLTKDEKTGLGRQREYRLKLGEASLTAVFTLGVDGKISGFRLR